MIFLAIAFTAFLLSLFWYRQALFFPSATKAPPVEKQPTATPLLSPTLIPSGPLYEMEKDLQLIEADVDKMKEDNRFQPPSFFFDLGLEEQGL